MPRMVMLTYKMPERIIQTALSTEFNEFDLNVFFEANGKGDQAKFVMENEVQKWIDIIRGSSKELIEDDLRLEKRNKPPMPFSSTTLLNLLSHTLWFLPSVASCFAMRNLLMQRQNNFFHSYKIIVSAGNEAGMGADALKPVYKAMEDPDPLKTKTITLTCRKLTTGVTVKPWTGILMLKNIASPESYFQAAFRVQSPWTIKNLDGKSPNKEEVIKDECYVFDFAPNRALTQIAEYSLNLNVSESYPEKKVDDFIKFLPILAYDGSSFRRIDAQSILDISVSGTSATLLAKKWESATLINMTNDTLNRLLNNQKALDALMSIEDFRGLKQDLEMIINKSEAINKIKKDKKDKTDKEKKNLLRRKKNIES